MAVNNALVLAKHETYFAATDANVPGRNVRILTDVPVKLGHERLAKTHDLAVALSLRIEIGATLGGPHREAGEAVLEDLFKTEKLQNALVHASMKTKAAFERSDCGVELDTPGAVRTNAPIVILPGNTEDDDAIRLGQAFENLRVLILPVIEHVRHERLDNLTHRLVKLGFMGISPHESVHELLNFLSGRVKFGHFSGDWGWATQETIAPRNFRASSNSSTAAICKSVD